MTTKQTLEISLPGEAAVKQLGRAYNAEIRKLTGLALKAEATYIDTFDRRGATAYELKQARQHYELALTRLGRAINEFNGVARQYSRQAPKESRVAA